MAEKKKGEGRWAKDAIKITPVDPKKIKFSNKPNKKG